MFGLNDRQSVERLEFSNGYTASVAKYAGEYQVAVLFNGKICYDTPVTNDVIRCETMAKVYLVLLEISALPKREG